MRSRGRIFAAISALLIVAVLSTAAFAQLPRVVSGWVIYTAMGFAFEATENAGPDVGLKRSAAGEISLTDTINTYGGSLKTDAVTVQTANASTWKSGVSSELITLSTGGATTDSTANLLPANSLIDAVNCRVTTTITTATDWALGDATVAARFAAANATMTAGATSVGIAQWNTANANNAGPVQGSAAKLRITTTGTPGAGAVRCSVFYRTPVAPTS
jgi:hypothetical protein